jgi:predicted dehydrogenase
MSQSVGIGIIGCGSIGIRGALDHFVLEDMKGIAHVAACCDPVDGRADAAAAKYGVPNAYRTEDEVFADPSVDAVIICSPIGLHYDQGVKAIEAGKHIHFNKTMTTISTNQAAKTSNQPTNQLEVQQRQQQQQQRR